ncbi:hypothetical protein BN938_2456 [Mucinivorans hirudinis]|uniref:Uncharacterized protein n=1 Tax=Mucinivorans hirudinis TaxID=1433126 RepID=A0A060RA67_9BACT|nr:hypothetical protein BN938_2456 [Mucinivorans hirudinis]
MSIENKNEIKKTGEFLVNSSFFYTFIFTSKERYKQRIRYATKSNKQHTPRCKSVSTSP